VNQGNGRKADHVPIPPDLLHAEIKRIAEQGASSDEAQEILDMIVEDVRNQSRLITLGLLRARVGRFLRQADMLAEVEERMYDPDRLKTANTDDLLRMHRTISTDLFKTLELILPDIKAQPGVESEGPGLLQGSLHLHYHQHEEEDREINLPRKNRENLVNFFIAVDHALRGKGRQLAPAKEEQEE
jgi:hypothetical protein